MWTLLYVLSVILNVYAKNEEYIGHKIYNIKFNNQEQADRLAELKGDLIDFLRKPSYLQNIIGKVKVPPSEIHWFEHKLSDLRIERDVVIDDVYEYLSKKESDVLKKRELTRINDDGIKFSNEDTEQLFDFNGYYRYDVILKHIYALRDAYTNSWLKIRVEEFGRTEQNRSVIYMKISENTSQKTVNISDPDENFAGDDNHETYNVKGKPVIIIEGGMIPREWVTIPAALNVVKRILENEDLVKMADWIIVPVVNPDGYEYTHTNLRLWSKSMSTNSHTGFICPGVNINRNFDIEWRTSDSSTSPCSHIYAGTEPFSETESQMLKYLIDTYKERTRLYISLQNSGGFISFPWQSEKAATGLFRQHLLLGLDMIEAMHENYKVDVGWAASGDRVSGTASDYAQKNGILYSFNVNIVQKGEDGVNIPESEIVDIIEDVWRGISVAVNRLIG